MYLILGPCEKRAPIRPDDNLRTGEGDFVTPEKQKYIPAERPKQVKPVDNLRTSEATFEQREEFIFRAAERPKAVKPTDQVFNKQIATNSMKRTRNIMKLKVFVWLGN